jgi:tRNA pseudouridine38-40 synthase
VQGTIERAVAQIYKRHLTPEAPLIPVIGASRTDTGVHAEMQVAHFDAPVEPSEAWDLRYALQCLLPESLVITKLLLAPRDFHAIACTSSKTYRFQILNQKVPSALLRHRVWWIRHPLRIENLNAMARLVVGQHDFAAFQTSGSPVPSTTRTIFAAQWDEVGDEILAFSVSGSGFLKQMVRNLVGTMVDLDRSGAGPDEFAKVLASRDRRQAGVTAEPQGLYLQRVDYPPEIDNRCVHLY